ncbi:EscI/YscI/HrpB family type III secretion system inner rod protein [Vibrio chagasii]|uniref:EscI/YscI/HrpB family type III secretion system inner rod protein n=1 Tax=Vibrio chagasii TaxID=170679 RepID=A0A7Y4DTR1_9VIBR|nr:EscI/YscI/HrpB family type III secretion system inner rod protein [Vibrio chagasii]NOH36025.1 EscI/YscI/HrpB family type III secretion system inner rod protein [Vibrio chagasii]
MKVDDLNVSKLIHNEGVTEAFENKDVQWFTAQLSSLGDVPAKYAAQVDFLPARVDASSELRRGFDRALTKVVNSRDPVDLLNVSRSMSDFYMQTMLTTKVIAKGVQSVEKLTSLQ